jgi:Arc/MetJ-type ribon-helix-helix transcriptional regulator
MADTEKITINLGVVDLGQIDLLVSEGFYTNRTDFIRTAIRNQVATHADSLGETVKRRSFVVGVLIFNRRDLTKRLKAGEQTDVKVVGMFILANDVDPQLALATISSVEVYGIFRASSEVKQALKDRIK